MHVVVNANGTYVNGVSVGSGSAISAGTIGTSCELYLAAFCFIDGQASLEPTAFGRYNSQGVWVPVDAKGLTYGANGFHLDFSDPNDLGKDVANGNDFTAAGFETADTSSADYDLMLDSPTQNYATINPLYPGASTTKANLNTANTTGKPTILGVAGDVGVEGASVAWDGTKAGWNSTGHINFGQQPGGFDEFSTRTIPAATIPNGREHFQAITDTGANILPAAQAAFPNGLWWIKDRVNANQHQLVDSVTNAIFGGNKANTLPTNSQAIDYVAPSGNSVAWCWNAADPATSGFNIVQYTGQNPTTTAVPHGLGKAPDMIFTFAKSGTTRNPAVYLSETGPSKYFILSNTDGAISDSTIWANTAPDETNFYVGSANTTNFPGATFVAYCWTAIPGYSAFGSYTGNGDPNGPVIVTGFRPAFILTKRATADEDWSIVDTTRSIDNPAFQNLRPNQTNGEGGGIGSNDIDILSNGFKLRNNTDRFNSTGTYVYACWAENPFQSPATAR
jgi:hypothetical protein